MRKAKQPYGVTDYNPDNWTLPLWARRQLTAAVSIPPALLNDFLAAIETAMLKALAGEKIQDEKIAADKEKRDKEKRDKKMQKVFQKILETLQDDGAGQDYIFQEGEMTLPEMRRQVEEMAITLPKASTRADDELSGQGRAANPADDELSCRGIASDTTAAFLAADIAMILQRYNITVTVSRPKEDARKPYYDCLYIVMRLYRRDIKDLRPYARKGIEYNNQRIT